MFTIIGPRRSGTHLLALLLDSHPKLTMYDELFTENKKHALLPHDKTFGELGKKEGWIYHYLEIMGDFYAVRSPDAVINDLSLVQVKGDYKILLQENKVIHLTRMNIRALALSFIRTQSTGLPFSDDGVTYEYDQQNVRLVEHSFMKQTVAIYELFARLSTDVFHMDYQDMRSGSEVVRQWDNECSQELLKFLEVEPIPLTCSGEAVAGVARISYTKQTPIEDWIGVRGSMFKEELTLEE